MELESQDVVVNNDPSSPSSATIATTNSNEINDDDDVDEKNKIKNESLPIPIPLESTTTTTTMKGKGLKKWRRIQRRDFTKDEEEVESGSSSSIDPNRILKRDLRSDNSEDPSSNKSSTAATIISPIKFRSHAHRSTTSNNTSNRVAASSSSVKNNAFGSYSSSSQRPNRIESTKKLRGSTSRIDKDASHSSVESDLRSSAANVFFTENISNGRHINYDVDNSSEAQASDQQSNDFVQTNYFKDNGEEEVSQDDDDDAGEASWEAKEEQSENQRRSTSQDLLAESILSLQAVHEALEKEIQHFGEIGKEPILLSDDSADHFLPKRAFHSVISEIPETKSSEQAPFEEIEKNGSLPLEAELIKIQSKVHLLERKLEDATIILDVKESRVVELEGILNERELSKEEQGSSLQSLQEKCKELETELDDLFKQKIEVEVECLAMRKTSQKLKVVSEDQVALYEEQKSLISEQNKLLHKFRDTESKIATKKEEVENLASFGESLDTVEVLKMHSRIRKHTFCFSVQLLLLCLVFGMLFLQSWPGSTGYVPT
ncbi:hypothetical protein AQUCO_00500301v1 [Aquilegia coerulea]|uniref:WPP domain-containing protein n=2 Tax=Aquilegia coerulea TaxID=218851 RepID=A0A2G5ERB6_AQUCA|nr:hypothetical protein AQUCO_00500301v1 [Aquilegia coerulea]